MPLVLMGTGEMGVLADLKGSRSKGSHCAEVRHRTKTG